MLVEERYDDVVPEGILIDTRPSGGNQVHKSGVVTLLVSLGVEMVDVPDLTNKSADEIDDLLAGAKPRVVTPLKNPMNLFLRGK